LADLQHLNKRIQTHHHWLEGFLLSSGLAAQEKHWHMEQKRREQEL